MANKSDEGPTRKHQVSESLATTMTDNPHSPSAPSVSLQHASHQIPDPDIRLVDTLELRLAGLNFPSHPFYPFSEDLEG